MQKCKTGRYIILTSCIFGVIAVIGPNYLQIYHIFYILIYILNSNMATCIAVETIQNIGANEFTYFSEKIFSLHLHTQTLRSFPTKIILISSADNSEYDLTNFFFLGGGGVLKIQYLNIVDY